MLSQNQLFHVTAKAVSRLTRLFVNYDLPSQISCRQQLPKGKPILIVSNHRSYFDIYAAFTMFHELGYSTRAMVYSPYFKSWPLGPILEALGAIPTSNALRQQAEDTAVISLQAGKSVSMMPEGAVIDEDVWRKNKGGVAQFRLGISRIATRANAAVVPMVIVGTQNVWPKDKAFPNIMYFIKQRPTVTIRFGEAIDLPSSIDHVENANFAAEKVTQLILATKEEETAKEIERQQQQQIHPYSTSS